MRKQKAVKFKDVAFLEFSIVLHNSFNNYWLPLTLLMLFALILWRSQKHMSPGETWNLKKSTEREAMLPEREHMSIWQILCIHGNNAKFYAFMKIMPSSLTLRGKGVCVHTEDIITEKSHRFYVFTVFKRQINLK